MRCKQCKTKIDKGENFCPSCGTPVAKRRKWPIVLVVVIVLLALGGAGLFVWVNFFSAAEEEVDSEVSSVFSEGDTSVSSTSEEEADNEVSDEYVYQETVLEEIDAATSEAVPTVVDVAAELDSRGFTDYEIVTHYDLSGTYLSDQTLELDSTEKYPLYNVYYTTPSGNMWVIYISNGEYMANPLFMYDPTTTLTLLTENDYIVAYEADRNVFIKSIPAETEANLKVVARIDAETLDGLDESGVAAL